MKKLLLLSALALCATASQADTFGDYFKVTYEGKTVENGGYINAPTTAPEGASYFEVDVKFENTFEEPISVLNQMFAVTPDFAEVSADKLKYGNVSLCYALPDFGNCWGGQDANKTLGEGKADVKGSIDTDENWMMLQIHEDVDFHDPDYPDYDYTNPRIPITVRVQATILGDDGETPTDKSFEFFVNYWNDGSGVEGIELDENSAAQYFDLQGRKIAKPSKGLFIERRNGKSTKVML